MAIHHQNLESQRSAERRTVAPRLDVVSGGDGATLYVDLPGVEGQSIDVSVERDIVTITAPRSPFPGEGLSLRHREWSGEGYYRAVRVSDELNTQAIEAQFKDGVLRLSIPRREDVKPRKVAIHGA